MTPSLTRWISDADALRHLEQLGVFQGVRHYEHIRLRTDDYYLSLVGELFARMRTEAGTAAEWARLGNALVQVADKARRTDRGTTGVSFPEATLFAAAAFYCGGFPASAYLTIKSHTPDGQTETHNACFDLLARPTTLRSRTVAELFEAFRRGEMTAVASFGESSRIATEVALQEGPSEWIHARLFEQLLRRFLVTNVRAVLPDGGSSFWTPLVDSFLSRRPPNWEFFPSQIQAFRAGLLERAETFSLQMPTGAGKTAICETLLYWHAKREDTSAAVLLVPFRSLASELRGSLVRRLNAMGISARCAYGGTVPTGDEVRGLADTRVMVATPESLSGLLSADEQFLKRIGLVICDEGHLLDGGGRGIGLELLLARMKAREGGPPRFVFVSAIVPNIEDINAWLGGTRESVVRSDYRPSLAEFARLRPSGEGTSTVVVLEMHPHEVAPTRFEIGPFLSRSDFIFKNPETGRNRTYKFESVKTQAIASARKALGMGASAVFAANKRGAQGAIGLAEELLEQLEHDLPLPKPLEACTKINIDRAARYLELEYGPDWVGTKVLLAGAVLHHGDIPQETREVLEDLLRQGSSHFVICTSTLAEGVNLPIRTLVLYSIQRRQKNAPPIDLLARDIKNLVGRAGRAGATTKGLVICANENQWRFVWPVARQTPGEPVNGALRAILDRLRYALAVQSINLDNSLLEGEVELHPLVDGIDAALIDLAAEEIGEDRLSELAGELARTTFAWQQVDETSQRLLQSVFRLRAERVAAIRTAGRLGWFRQTGARARALASVENDLLGRRSTWNDVTDPLDPALVQSILEWAWTHTELQSSIRQAYRLDDTENIEPVQGPFFKAVGLWLAGRRFSEMATSAEMQIDDLLGLHTGVISFQLQTLVEQGIALLAKLLEAQGILISEAVTTLPEHLRFGVPTAAARVLATGGVSHRRAAVELGHACTERGLSPDSRVGVFHYCRELLTADEKDWRAHLGDLVFENSLREIVSMTGADVGS